MMKLSFYCKSCQKENYFKTKATNRHELEMEIGKEFNKRCTNCGNFTKNHINRLFAEVNHIPFLIALIVTVVIAFILFWYVGLISSLVTALPSYVWYEQAQKVRGFNRTMVK